MVTKKTKTAKQVAAPVASDHLAEWVASAYDYSNGIEHLPENFEALDENALAQAILADRPNRRFNEHLVLDCYGTHSEIAKAILLKLEDVRKVLSGAEFDSLWKAFKPSLDYGVMSGDAWIPKISYNGAVLVRNYHRVIELDKRPHTQFQVENDILRDELVQLKEAMHDEGMLDDDDAFWIIHHDDFGISWTKDIPEQLSSSGQTLVFVPQVWFDKAQELGLEYVGDDSLGGAVEESRVNIAVLRVFSHRTFVYTLERSSDSNDVVLEEFSEWLGDSPESGDVDEPSKMNFDLHPTAKVEQRIESILDDGGSSLDMTGVSDILQFLLRKDLKKNYGRDIIFRMSEVLPIFTSDHERAPGYYGPGMYESYSQAQNGGVVVFELTAAVGNRTKGFKKNVMDAIRKAFVKSDIPMDNVKLHVGSRFSYDWFDDSEEKIRPFDAKDKGLTADFKALIKTLENAVKEAVGDNDLTEEELDELQKEILDDSRYFIHVLVLTDTDPTPSEWDRLALTLSENVGSGNVNMRIPSYGFQCGYCDGEHDTGNNFSLIPKDADDEGFDDSGFDDSEE